MYILMARIHGPSFQVAASTALALTGSRFLSPRVMCWWPIVEKFTVCLALGKNRLSSFRSSLPHHRALSPCSYCPPLILGATLEMKTAMRMLFLLALIPLPLLLDVCQNGFAIGGPCDFGFGKRLQTVQEGAIRDYFLEKLPSSIDVGNVTCSGFTDSTVIVSFRVSHGEAERLVAGLEATFLTPQNHPMVGDSGRRRMLIGPPAHRTHIYHLPGLPLFDVRTVCVSIPKDVSAPSTVVFEGGND